MFCFALTSTHVSVEEVLMPVLVQLGVIILAARVFAALFRKLGQPSVVGEIVAGLILGPSVLGNPRLGEPIHSLWQAIFQPELPPGASESVLFWIFTALSQIGLIFLLFLIGLEFDFSHLRWHGPAALAISLVGVALPFALGFGLALWMRPSVDSAVNWLGFALFFGTALSITAIPILGRMMMELNITRTRLGAITISAAAVDDAAGWILLAAVAAIVRGNFDPASALRMGLETLAFALAMVFLARPLLRRWVRRVLDKDGSDLSLNALAVLLIFIFACAIATNRIGIFAIFGAFLLGAVLSGEHELRQAINRRLRDFVTVFFLPIFFTYTGLRTDIGALETPQLWLWCGLVVAAAIVGKFAGCGLAAWASGFSFREAGCIGAMMNTRALMALIVINLGKDLGVVNDSVFCMLVIMALVTTLMTTPILLRLMRGTELEPYILESGFVSGGSRQ